MASVLETPRLLLVPITLPLVEAVISGDRKEAERIACARIPAHWSGKDLVTRAFSASMEAIRANPEKRLWGDRLMISRELPRRVQGSVIFHGRPDEDGVAEVAYGVESEWQGQGLCTEAVRACVAWALEQPGVSAVRAATFAFHKGSLRVMEKLGMRLVETRDSDLFGEMLVYELRRQNA